MLEVVATTPSKPLGVCVVRLDILHRSALLNFLVVRPREGMKNVPPQPTFIRQTGQLSNPGHNPVVSQSHAQVFFTILADALRPLRSKALNRQVREGIAKSAKKP